MIKGSCSATSDLLRPYTLLWILCIMVAQPVASKEGVPNGLSSVDGKGNSVSTLKDNVGKPDAAEGKSEPDAAEGKSNPDAGKGKRETDTKDLAVNDTGWMWILMLCLALISLLLMGLVVWLYRWRIRLSSLLEGTDDGGGGAPYVAIVAEKWEAANLKQAKAQDDQSTRLGTITEKFNSLVNYSQSVDSKVERMAEGFSALQNTLSNAEEENKRLKEGYDFSILKHYMLSLIKLDEQIDRHIEDDEIDIDNLRHIKDDLSDVIADAGVRQFVPVEGDAYASTSGLEENPKLISTTDKDKDRTIESVLVPGYMHEKGQVIRQARVRVFTYQLNDQVKEEE